MVLRTGFAADWDRGLQTGGFEIDIDSATGVIRTVAGKAPDGPWSRCVAVPGLVQPHLHLCQTLFRGAAENRGLLEWLSERIWPLEAAHSADTLATSAVQSLKELIGSGCTALLDMGSVEGSSITVDILRRTGIKAHAANSLMDKGADCLARDPGWLEEESRRVRSSCGGLVRYAAAPRFALSCSDEIWRMVSALPGSVLRTTHCAESPDELDDPAIAADGGNVRFLEKRGFLGPGTVLAHCIHLAHGEVEILSESGTAVAHCPWANLRLGSGIADAASLMDAGILVFPASDGAACNNRLDLSSDIRLAMSLMSFKRSPQAVSGRTWMKAATELAGGFLGTRHGRLAPGFDADIAVIDPGEEETVELARAEDPLRYLLELDWASRIRLVLVRGRVLFENGGFPTLPVAPMSVAGARSEVLARAGVR